MKFLFPDNYLAFFLIALITIYFPPVIAENINTAAPFMLNDSIAAKITDSIVSSKTDTYNATQAMEQTRSTADTFHRQFNPDTIHANLTNTDSILPSIIKVSDTIGKKDSSVSSSVVRQKKEDKTPVSDVILKIPGVRTSHKIAKKNILHILMLLTFFCIIVCFVLFARGRNDITNFVTRTRLSIMDKEVQLACRYIEKNYKNPALSTDIICKNLITGKPFLEALFRQELGIDIELFITHVRINRAVMLIEQKHDIDADIAALETGFSNTETFCKAFNDITGVKFDKYLEVQAKHEA